MQIENSKWFDSTKTCVSITTIDGRHMAVPVDAENIDYDAILKWVALDDANKIVDPG